MSFDWLTPPWVTAFVAVVALFRPELSKWLGIRFRPGRLRLDATPVVEIGFSGLGPLVALAGALRPIDRSHFVEGLAVTVIRQKDNATHRFQWEASRTLGLQMGWDPSGPPPPVDYPVPFQAEADKPHSLNAVFTEPDMRSEVEAIATNLGKEFFDFWNANRIANANSGESIDSAFERFQQSGKLLPYWTEVDKRIYWQQGPHRLEVLVTTSNPERQYQFAWDFELKESDVASLKANALRVLRQACGVQNLGFNAAFCPISKTDKNPYVQLPPPKRGSTP